ncbi:MAG TPA: NAD(P)-binding domain-containing protein [Allosphingosinicella sp.]|nr:NAD(P)-binding domain-containing protein [Allosphingosinicella sp.]
MKIAIIGAGNVGTALKTGLSRTGHDVGTVGRDDNAAHAAQAAELIILAVPFAEVGNVASQLGSAASGKIVIDATNALSPAMELAVDTSTTSGAEELQKKLPEARVVKAFNTTFATAMATGQINGEKLAGLVAADDAEAKAAVLGLVQELGFDPIDAGPLSAARLLEPLALLNIKLGFVQGYGPASGFRLVH